MNQYIANFFKGLGVGSANVIPGVSGGTIALITGIFERLINALKSFNLTAIKLFFSGKFKEFAQHTDLWFLASVGAGVVAAATTPAPTEARNHKSVCCANSLNLPLKNNFIAVRLKDFNALIKRSKMPVIKAIVPPETPGMTLAEPTPSPLKKLAMY